MIQDLVDSMKQAVEKIRRWRAGSLTLFHHNDTDGITSGAILKKAFERSGHRVHRVCLEKPYPAVLEQIFRRRGRLMVFADFAGRIAPRIAEMNRGRNLVVILDHHVAENTDDPRVLNLDPDLFGLKGDRDISASCTCSLFANILHPGNRDLVNLAALGAVGDEFFVDGKLVGENRKAIMEAVALGLAEVREKPDGEQYFFKTNKGNVPGEKYAGYLDTLGAAGFYQKGPDIAVLVCLEGFSRESDALVDRLKVVKDGVFSSETTRLKQEGFFQSPHIQWFHVENRFEPMGVKMIGVFCDLVKKMDFVDPHKYLAGYQVIPAHVPGFGDIAMNEVKISMRVPPMLEKNIREGRAMGLDVLLPEATARMGGFSDACHSLTAATTVQRGAEERLVEEMENILAGK